MSVQCIPFQCDDGAHNHLTLYPSERSNAHQAWLLILPALGVAAKHYHHLATSFNEHGIHAATVDLRGNGHSSLRASRQCDFSYQTLIEQDIHSAVQCLKEHTDHASIVLFGHSIGGQLSMLYTSQYPDKIDGIILSASCSVYYRGWSFPLSWGLLLLSQLSVIVSQLCGYFPGKTLRFGGREARSLMSDWARNARSGKYRLLNSTINYQASMANCDTKILAINYADDTFAPKSATDNLLNTMPHASVEKVCLSGSDVGLTKVNHMNWLKHPTAISTYVSKFLNSMV